MYPDWVIKQKRKGTNISCINGRYYLYAVGSVWNKEKGRAQKITQEYLGHNRKRTNTSQIKNNKN